MAADTHYGRYDTAADELDAQLARLERMRDKTFADGTALLAGSLMAFHQLPRIHELVAMYAIAVERFDLALTHLRHASVYHSHIFSMSALPRGESVAFQPPDVDRIIGSGTTGPLEATTHRAWLDAFALALTVDDGTTVDRLLLVDELYVPPPHQAPNAVFEPLVALYKATVSQPSNLVDIINHAIGAMVEATPPDFQYELAHLAAPNVKVYAAVAGENQAMFTAAVDEANEAHDTWYRMGNRTGEPRALLNTHTAAMVALGRSRGLVAPTSPYLPPLL